MIACSGFTPFFSLVDFSQTDYQNGKTKFAFFTLSDDKFTLYVTTSQIKNKKGGNGVFRPILRKVTSIGSNNDDEYDYERAIDVGSIIRIQKGQNTLRFELAR